MKKMTTIIVLIVFAVVLGAGLAYGAYAKKKGLGNDQSGIVSGSAAMSDTDLVASDTDAAATPTDTGLEVVVQQDQVENQPVAEVAVVEPEKTAEKATVKTTAEKKTTAATAKAQPSGGDELMLLARIVHAEARGESDEGQQAVANVVLNRVQSGKFPNTISAVIYQKGQFTPASKGSFSSIQPSQKCIDNARAVLNGKRILPADVLYFSCGSKGRSVYKKIGNQTFYK